MAFANNEGVRIHYEVEGDGPPLVIQHGYSDSIATWYELGYVDALKGMHWLMREAMERVTSRTTPLRMQKSFRLPISSAYCGI
jgi:pimeloyl-ACP methyl ester carboxylesterase